MKVCDKCFKEMAAGEYDHGFYIKHARISCSLCDDCYRELVKERDAAITPIDYQWAKTLVSNRKILKHKMKGT